MRLPALCLLCALPAVAQLPTDFIPPHSNVVIGINLRRILDAAQLKEMDTDSQSLSAMMLAQNGLSHLDPLRAVDSILIASTGEGEAPPAVSILRGHFAGLKLDNTKNSKGTVLVIDDSTMLAGDAAEVHAAMMRYGPKPELAARIAALDAKFDFWGTGDSPNGFGGAKGQGGGVEAVDHFEFGGSFRNGFSLDGEIHARTAGDAKKVAEWLKFFETMTGSQQNAANGTKFSVHTEDGTLKLSLRIPEEELKKAIAAQKASMAAAVKAQAQPQPKPDPHGKIVTNAAGDTVSVTLPGGHW